MGVKVRERIEGSGVWWVFINHRGKRKAKKVGSQESADEVKQQVEARLVLGKEFLPEEKPVCPTLGDYFKRFEKTYLAGAIVRQSTQRGYRGTFANHILPAFKSKRLDEITREKVEEFIGKLHGEKHLAKNYIRVIVSNLSAVLERTKVLSCRSSRTFVLAGAVGPDNRPGGLLLLSFMVTGVHPVVRGSKGSVVAGELGPGRLQYELLQLSSR